MIVKNILKKSMKTAMTVSTVLAVGMGPAFAGKVSGEAYSVDVDLTVDIGDLLGLTNTLSLDALGGLGGLGSLGGLGDLVGDQIGIKVGPVPHADIPYYGGFDSETLASVNLLDIVSSKSLANLTAGAAISNNAGSASASVVEDLNLLGGLISAQVLGSYCSSATNGSVAVSDASSSLLGLTIAGQPVNVATAPNTTIDLLGTGLFGLPITIGTVIVNEQITGGDGVGSSSITNNALHVSISNPEILSLLLGEVIDGDIVVSSAHCDVDVNGQDDQPSNGSGGFVTGGGRLDIPGGFATFGFNVQDGKVQLEFIDHVDGLKIVGDTLSSLDILDTGCAVFSGLASVGGVTGYNYTATVCDLGEPGRNNDSFSLELDNGYLQSAIINAGNILLHQ